MGAEIPKQYLSVCGRPLAEHTLTALLSVPSIVSVRVALSVNDAHWDRVDAAIRNRVQRVTGGDSRAHSVLAGLQSLHDCAADDDWVLVHDMARPCISVAAIERMIATLDNDPVGGLLAIPVVDTLKRSDADERVVETVARETLWQAQTPQLFRYKTLLDALAAGLERGVPITDEASAIELHGLQPKLVHGDAENMKVTVPGDLMRVEQILRSRWGGAI